MCCPFCGTENPGPRARFCRGCGRPLPAAQSRPARAVSSAAAPALRLEQEPHPWLKWVTLAVCLVAAAVVCLIVITLRDTGAAARQTDAPPLLTRQTETVAKEEMPALPPDPPAASDGEENALQQPPAQQTDRVSLPGGGYAPAADFVFPSSGTELLTSEQLEARFGGLDRQTAWADSQLAINEIYARYGYNFHPEKSDSAAAAYRYFHSLDWYQQICGANTASGLGEVPLNRVEQQNVSLLAQWQSEQGMR